MKITLLAAAAALSIVTATAHAESEGAGEPFPFSAPGVTIVNPPSFANTSSDAYPDLRGHPSQTAIAGGDLLPVNGSEGAVQTAASLPRGFSDGTVAYAQAQSVARFLAEREGRARLAARSLAAQHPAGAHRG